VYARVIHGGLIHRGDSIYKVATPGCVTVSRP
jgi:hypothetical protein